MLESQNSIEIKNCSNHFFLKWNKVSFTQFRVMWKDTLLAMVIISVVLYASGSKVLFYAYPQTTLNMITILWLVHLNFDILLTPHWQI